MSTERIRNFCIIAHIDHGKSTLADRLLEETHTLLKKEMKAQVLDDMDLERERGITIKSHPIQMKYIHSDKHEYTLNLIDTPGHVDFSYEGFAFTCCNVRALYYWLMQLKVLKHRRVSNAYLAIDNDLVLIPVINKVDLPSARIDEVKEQIVELIGC